MINYNDFTGKYYPAPSEQRQNDVARFLDSLDKLVGDTPLSEALKNKKNLCSVFYLQKTGNISRSHYQKVKEYLLNLFDYVNIQSNVPTREEVIASNETNCYFRSIDALLNFIDSVGEQKIDSYNPTTDLVRMKAVCVLGWIGLSPTEISNIKREDLKPIDINGFSISTKNGTYEIYGEPFTALFYLLDLEEYNSLPSKGSRGRKIVLKGETEYLFRSQDIESENLNEKQIVLIISRFNTSNTGNTAIIFRNLYKNALFLELYNDNSNTNLITKITNIFGCTRNGALSYREQYLQFAEAMDSNKI